MKKAKHDWRPMFMPIDPNDTDFVYSNGTEGYWVARSSPRPDWSRVDGWDLSSCADELTPIVKLARLLVFRE